MAFIKHELALAVWAGYFYGRMHERKGGAYPSSPEDLLRLVAEQEASDEIQRELGIYGAAEREYRAMLAERIAEARQKREQQQQLAVAA